MLPILVVGSVFVDMIEFFANYKMVDSVYVPVLLSVHICEPKLLFNFQKKGRYLCEDGDKNNWLCEFARNRDICKIIKFAVVVVFRKY